MDWDDESRCARVERYRIEEVDRFRRVNERDPRVAEQTVLHAIGDLHETHRMVRQENRERRGY